MGNKVPDLRGLFLRGHGGKSGALRTVQNESVYINPSSTKVELQLTKLLTPGSNDAEKIFALCLMGYAYSDRCENTGGRGISTEVQMSIKGTGEETRPINMAVRYLIRALP